MRIAPSPDRRARRTEPIIPMINVIFLLLIFLLLSASIAPQDLLSVEPPEAAVEAAGDVTAPLLIAADGGLALGGAAGEAVWPLLAARDGRAELAVRADAALSAKTLTAILTRLAATTPAPVVLVVRPREAAR